MIIDRTPSEKLFWAKVSRTAGCWEWQGGQVRGNPRGWLYGEAISAWRAAWALSREDEAPLRRVGTTCQEAMCVRPDHQIFPPRYQAAEMQALVHQGVRHQDAARHFGISREHLTRLVNKHYRETRKAAAR